MDGPNDGEDDDNVIFSRSLSSKMKHESYINGIDLSCVVWHLDVSNQMEGFCAGNSRYNFGDIVIKRCSSHSKKEKPGCCKQRLKACPTVDIVGIFIYATKVSPEAFHGLSVIISCGMDF